MRLSSPPRRRARPSAARVSALLLATLALPAFACGDTATTPSPSARGREASKAAGELPRVALAVAHRDADGRPTFAWLAPPSGGDEATPRFTDAPAAVHAAVTALARELRLTADVAATLGRDGELVGAARGMRVARVAQRVRGLAVEGAGLRVGLSLGGEPVAVSGHVAERLAGSEHAFVLTPDAALTRALALSGGVAPALARTSRNRGDDAASAEDAPAELETIFEGGRSSARATKVLAEVEAGLEPAYRVETMLAHGPARWTLVSALDGRVLATHDLARNEAATYRVYADAATGLPLDGPQGRAFSPHPAGRPDRRRPAWVPSQLVTLANFPFSKNDPWLGADATTTSGNNARAYADLSPEDGFNGPPDTYAHATGPRTFDHLYDTGARPGASEASVQASVTHLFYVTNFLHDWFYDAGFDEPAGNPQVTNFGRGGRGGDPIFVEAQDASGRNNANAATPGDGMSPRIQMYVFSGPSSASLAVASPAGVAGVRSVGIASGFGLDSFDVPGTLVVAEDEGGVDVADACEPLVGQVAGRIVLAHRGTCAFVDKALRAQEAGALGLVIANVPTSASPASAPFMGGTSAAVTIPVLSLSLADGQALEGAARAGGVEVTMKREVGVDLDGALDTSIVAHEWGHVLSNRLVFDGAGLFTNQAGGLGEGWGDFVSLLVMAREGDAGAFGGTYANGVYATSGSGDDVYFGIRRLPYSVDLAKNPLTFKHVQNGVPLPEGVDVSFGEDGSGNAEVHAAGEVWATMLWECYVGLLRDGRHSFSEAQARMKRYLVSSLALTPRNPTFLEARDAVLAAAYAVDAGDFQVFWRAFAKRGAGAGAKGPGRDSVTNLGVVESFDAGGAVEIASVSVDDDVVSCDRDGILDDGEQGSLVVTLRNAGSTTVDDGKLERLVRTTGARLTDDRPVDVTGLRPFEVRELRIPTSVTAPAPAALVDLDVQLVAPSLGSRRTTTVRFPARYQADEVADSSVVDDVETSQTNWEVTGRREGRQWSRVADEHNRFWRIVPGYEASDHRLVSAPFAVDGTRLVVTFRHRFSFRSSTRRQVDLDGGVLEVSTDGGRTFVDAGELGAIDYGVTLTTQRSDNPLRGRRAYGKTSEGFPAEWQTGRAELTLPAPSADVVLRFRAGTSTTYFTTSGGWDVDDIGLEGATTKPFFSFQPHADACDPEGPTVNAGPPSVVKGGAVARLAGEGSHPTNAPLTWVWRQVEGPGVTLREGEGATPSFDAPSPDAAVTLVFEARAHDGARLSAPSRTTVEVLPADAPAEALASAAGGCDCRAGGATSGAARSGRGASAASAAAFALAALVVGRRGRRRPNG